MSEDKKAAGELVKKAPIFQVENTVRKVGSRLHRAMSPTRHRFKQYIAGKRLLRNKKLSLSEAEFRQNEEQIVELVLAGIVAVHTPENIRVTSLPAGEFVLTKMGSGATKILAKGEIPTCFGGEGVSLVQETDTPEGPKTNTESPTEEELETKPEESDVTEMTPDDLTELPNIGAGRARKLEFAGIATFQDVSGRKNELTSLLNVTDDVAAEIAEAAFEKLGG